jgi:hypothetical protein
VYISHTALPHRYCHCTVKNTLHGIMYQMMMKKISAMRKTKTRGIAEKTGIQRTTRGLGEVDGTSYGALEHAQVRCLSRVGMRLKCLMSHGKNESAANGWTSLEAMMWSGCLMDTTMLENNNDENVTVHNWRRYAEETYLAYAVSVVKGAHYQ